MRLFLKKSKKGSYFKIWKNFSTTNRRFQNKHLYLKNWQNDNNFFSYKNIFLRNKCSHKTDKKHEHIFCENMFSFYVQKQKTKKIFFDIKTKHKIQKTFFENWQNVKNQNRKNNNFIFCYFDKTKKQNETFSELVRKTIEKYLGD